MPSLQSIAEVLNDLLASEHGSPFASVVRSTPHLGQRGLDVGRAIKYIATADARRAADLWSLIDSLGLEALPGRHHHQAEAYLSIAYVLPKLIDAKQRVLQQYREAIAALGEGTPSIAAILKRHLTEHAGELEVLAEAIAE